MNANNNPRKLAEVVRKALTDSSFRLALEAGTISAASLQLSPVEMDSVARPRA